MLYRVFLLFVPLKIPWNLCPLLQFVVKVDEFASRILDSKNTTRTLLDFTQNISGWVRLTVDGKKGDVVTIRHAEVLEPGPNLHTAALRTAKATDHFTLDRDGRHVLEPKFTFHGFQFAEVTGPAKFISAVGVAISSANERRGFFTSSDARLNRLHQNVVWSIAAIARVPRSEDEEETLLDEEGNPIYQSVATTDLIPYLTGALKEAILRIEALEGE